MSGEENLYWCGFADPARSESEALELLASAAPDDAVARARALGRFLEEPPTSPAVFHDLLRWFVRHRPNDDICAFPQFMALGEGEEALARELEARWREHEVEGRLDVRGLQNASQFFGGRDWREAERLRLAAMAIAEDPLPVAVSLGKLRVSLAAAEPELAEEHARAALDYLREPAESEPRRADWVRQYARQLSAEAALLARELDTAYRYAELLLDAHDEPHGLRHHVAHHVLGRIALLEGDVPRARAALLAAADTPADHVTSSYGPRLTLAKQLLAAGERAAVLTYLRKRAETWVPEFNLAGDWIASIEAGEAPDWDDYRDHV